MRPSKGRLLRRGRRWLRRLAFSLVPLALLLVAVEVALRVAGEPAPPPRASSPAALSMAPHPTRIWGLSPGEIVLDGVVHTIGANTLREVKPSGAPLRALTLGDSSIFGHGLEDRGTLHVQLSEVLGGLGVDVDVFCGGVSGYSTEQSLRLLDEVGWALEPDLLIIGNLWSDNSEEYFVDREWLAALDSPARRMDRILSWSMAWGALRRLQVPEQAQRAGLPIGWVKEPYSTRVGRRRVPLSDYAANLDRMLLEAAERGVGAVFLAPCHRHRLAPKTHASLWDPYFEAMAVVAERRGVPVVQAVEVLRAGGFDGDAAFLDELHPTAAANRAYAEELAAVLLGRGWPADRLVPADEPPPVTLEIEDPFARQ